MRPLIYVSDGYPRIPETFTRREVQGLHADGLPITVVTLHGRRDVDPDLTADDPPVIVAPFPGAGAVLRSFAEGWARQPRLAAWLTWKVVGAPTDPLVPRWMLRSPAHLAWGFWLAQRIPRGAHVHAQFLGAACTVAWVASRLAGATFSFTAHSEWGFALLREKLGDASFVLAVSEHEKRRLLARAPDADPSRIVVHRMGVDLPPVTPPSPGDPPQVVAVGSIGPTKGHEILVRASALLRDRRVRHRVTIVGGGAGWDALRAEVARLRLDDNVRLLGARPHAETLELIRSADVVALACRQTADDNVDGIPIALIEGMAAGRATLSTRVGGIPELITDGVSGRLVDHDRPDQLAEAIEALLRDPALRQRLGAEGRRVVEQRHDAVGASRRLRDVFVRELARAEAPAVLRAALQAQP